MEDLVSMSQFVCERELRKLNVLASDAEQSDSRYLNTIAGKIQSRWLERVHFNCEVD